MDSSSNQNPNLPPVDKQATPVTISQPRQKHHAGAGWRVIGIVLLCFVASFLGSWVFLGTGLVQTPTNITESRRTVLAEGEVVADVAERVSPSVVSILTESVSQSQFLGPMAQEGAGTGIIISGDGYVLTNKHVIPEGTTAVTVVLPNGQTYEDVEVVGRDPLNDIAFLKISGETDLPAATLGDSSEMSVGQKVVAIGNALGQYQSSVTSGIISGTSRSVVASGGVGTESEQLENLFQTDAAINPGNSGGPLVNLNGEVIGINTAVSQDGEGIGFAIPINDAKGLIRGVLADGEVRRAYLGVRYLTITPDVAAEFDLPQRTGAYIGGSEGNPVVDGGPADRAGLQEGDIITHVNDVELTERVLLISQLAQNVPGDTITLTILRDGNEREVQVTLEELQN